MQAAETEPRALKGLSYQSRKNLSYFIEQSLAQKQLLGAQSHHKTNPITVRAPIPTKPLTVIVDAEFFDGVALGPFVVFVGGV